MMRQQISEDNLANAAKFVKTLLYNGNSDERHVQTRVRLYEASKTKSSEALPLDQYWFFYKKRISIMTLLGPIVK